MTCSLAHSKVVIISTHLAFSTHKHSIQILALSEFKSHKILRMVSGGRVWEEAISISYVARVTIREQVTED